MVGGERDEGNWSNALTDGVMLSLPEFSTFGGLLNEKLVSWAASILVMFSWINLSPTLIVFPAPANSKSCFNSFWASSSLLAAGNIWKEKNLFLFFEVVLFWLKLN